MFRKNASRASSSAIPSEGRSVLSGGLGGTKELDVRVARGGRERARRVYTDVMAEKTEEVASMQEI